MEFSILLPLFIFLLSFVISALLMQFRPPIKNSHFPEHIICFITLTTTILCSLFFTQQDFISDFNIIKVTTPFGIALILSLLPEIKFLHRITAILILTSLTVFGLKLDTNIIPSLSLEINRIIAIIIWSFITLTFRINNKISEQILSSTALFGFGMFVLFLFKGVPTLLGLASLSMGASALAFSLKYWPISKFKLSNHCADSLGFLIGYYVILSIPEYSFGSTIILLMFPLTEVFLALILFSFNYKHSRNLSQNTSCSKALFSGLSEQVIAIHSVRIGLLMILFACFQLYAPSPYSLWLISILTVAWQQYRLMNWQQLSSGINATNQNVIISIKEGYSKLKKTINKTDKEDNGTPR